MHFIVHYQNRGSVANFPALPFQHLSTLLELLSTVQHQLKFYKVINKIGVAIRKEIKLEFQIVLFMR